MIRAVVAYLAYAAIRLLVRSEARQDRRRYSEGRTL